MSLERLIQQMTLRKFSKRRPLNKYGHRSNLETEILRRLKKHKGVKGVSYETTVMPYILTKNYVVDFTVTTKMGRTIFIEAKGWLRPEDRSKMRAVKALNPEADIRFCFSKNNKLYKGSSTTYGDWCERHGFPWCVGTIPKDWFE